METLVADKEQFINFLAVDAAEKVLKGGDIDQDIIDIFEEKIQSYVEQGGILPC